MASSTREVFLLLKARDEASRVLRGFTSEVGRSSRAMEAAAKRAEAAAKQADVVTRRNRSAAMSQAVAEKSLRAAAIDRSIAQARANGVSGNQLRSMRLTAQALRDEAREITLNQRAYDKETASIVANIRQLDREASELERAERDHRRFAGALQSAGYGLGTFAVGLMGVSAVSGYFFYNSFQDWQEYQRQVALTKTQVDGFSASMKDLSDIGTRVANDIAVPFEQIQPALFDIFSSTNANLKQSEILLRGFAKAAVAGQTDIQTAARGTIAIMNAYNIPFENVDRILDIQFELVRKGVGTYEEFAKVFGRVVPSATRAGQNFETVAAMLAYMTRNGQSAAMASTSAARALDAFSNPKSVKKLEKLGVKMRDVKGNLLPLVDILDQFRDKLMKLPAKERVGAILDVFKGAGGTIQARRFIEQVLLRPGELEDFKAMMKSMQDASGTMEMAYGEMADTAASKTQLLANKWQVLKIAVGEAAAPAIMKIIDALSKLLDMFNKLDPKTKNMIVTIGLIGTAVLLITGIVLGFVAALIIVVGAVAAVSSEVLIAIGVLAALGIAFAAIGAMFYDAYKKSKPLRDGIADMKKQFQEFWAKVKPVLDEIGTTFKEKVLPPLQELWAYIRDNIIPAFIEFRNEVWDVVAPKIIEAIRIIGDMVNWLQEKIGPIIREVIIPALKELSEWWAKNKKELMPFIEAGAQLLKWILIIGAVVVGVLVAAFIGPLIAAIAAVVGAFMLFVEAIKLVKSFLKGVKDFILDVWNSWSSIFGQIGDWFKGLPDEAKNSGASLVQGFIEGVKTKIAPLTTVMSAVANTISKFLPHSPAKVGPLSGQGSPYLSGVAIGNMLAAGMMATTTTLSTAAAGMAGAVTPMIGAGTYGPVSLGASSQAGFAGVNKTNNVTVHVYTQEIDPRKQAAELGWELSGRLG